MLVNHKLSTFEYTYEHVNIIEKLSRSHTVGLIASHLADKYPPHLFFILRM